MSGSKLGWSLWRVQRVGKQQKAFDETRFGGGEHRRLSSAIGMTAERDAAGHLASDRLDGGAKSLLVSFRASARWWAVKSRLAEGEIAAEDGEAGCAEGFRESDQQRSIAVRSCTVGEDEAVFGAICGARRGLVEESADGDSGGGIDEFVSAIHIAM
jgi:hypothetical protein